MVTNGWQSLAHTPLPSSTRVLCRPRPAGSKPPGPPGPQTGQGLSPPQPWLVASLGPAGLGGSCPLVNQDSIVTGPLAVQGLLGSVSTGVRSVAAEHTPFTCVSPVSQGVPSSTSQGYLRRSPLAWWVRGGHGGRALPSQACLAGADHRASAVCPLMAGDSFQLVFLVASVL